MYNAVDSIIVGNYVGRDALAAVGSSTSLIYLLIAFSQGAAVGAGVVVSQYLGANGQKGGSCRCPYSIGDRSNTWAAADRGRYSDSVVRC